VNSAVDIRQITPDEAARRAAFAGLLESWRVRTEQALAARLPAADVMPARLHEAMRYSVLGGGKRVRPALVFATGLVVGLREEEVEAAACAIELVHVYSLVHDDLPAMDNDDLRRGRPTCHKAYDEATAILVGDALQALAFSVLADDSVGNIAPAMRLAMIRALAQATGTSGMAGGQAVDLAAVGQVLTESAIENMHRRKTGALIAGSVVLGALGAGIGSGIEFDALECFGAEIGLAFQIQDDILDVEGDPAVLGKTTGADAAHSKPTYPSTVGLPAARDRARDLRDRAMRALQPLGARAAPLAELAQFVVNRVS
jgi:geranylgeranyl pyrophosphate synthase